jgi:pimeloyl-ACP methyl ester carboxylesterase
MATLSVEGGDIWYETRGEGLPLVFLHGAWSNTDVWDPQVERFADEYQVVRMDIRGHGRTGPTDPRQYSIELFADDLESLLAHLDIEEPILCGLSMGNIIAQEYLDRHPDRATAAVLGGPARSMPPVDLPDPMNALEPPPGLDTTLALAGSKTTFRTLLRSIRAATGGPWIAADPDVREGAIEAAGEIDTREFHKIYRALFDYDPPALDHVETPTMVIYGREESALVKRQGQEVADHVDVGSVVAVEEAAHLVNVDNPAAFNARVGAFLADLDD